VLYLLHLLLGSPTFTSSSPTSLGNLLTAGIRTIRRRSLVFVVSDFQSTPGWERPLLHLAQRNETLAIRLLDPLEMELPDLGMLLMQDSETGEQLFVDTHDRRFRDRFKEAAMRRQESLRRTLARAGVDAIELSTRDDLADAIFRFVGMRKLRSATAAGSVTSRFVTSGGARSSSVGG